MNILAFKTYIAGFLVAAYDNLSYHKTATQSKTYPGDETLYGAGNAVDRNTLTCMRTISIGTSSPDKTVWLKVDMGGVYSIYSINILFKNYEGLECEEGWFGVNCSQQCSGHCRDGSTCNHVTGLCDEGCNAGWTGYICEKECDDGTYGYNCVNNCSGHCLSESPCNKQTGQCDRGCSPGYTKSDCSKICLSGHYGTDCSERCSGNCINNEPCDHVSGVCPDGCEDGYTGKQCTNSCVEGHYGTKCSLMCPPNCLVCRHTDGYCSSCEGRYYGRNCSLICFPNCKSDTCQQTDSLCACDAGWMGTNCTEECDDGTYGFDCVNNCSGHCLNNSSCEKHNGQCKNGCNPGYTNLLCTEHVLQNSNDDKDISTSTIFLLVSVTFNVVFFTGCFVLLWGIYTKRVSIRGFNHSCWKRSKHYADTVIKTDEDQQYQELGPPREEISITYQNTVLQ